MPPMPAAKATRAPFRAEVRPRTKPREVRREELLSAAAKLFLEKGLAATSVDDIVSAADVAKGTFYLHFASKEALLLGLQQRFIQAFCAAVEHAVARKKADDWRGRLRTWVSTAVSAYLDQVALHDIVFHEFRPNERAQMGDNPVVDHLAALLRAGSAAGAWDVADPKLTAVMLAHALHGASDAALAADREGTRKNLTRALETFFLRAVGAE